MGNKDCYVINTPLTTDHCFDDSYVGNWPVPYEFNSFPNDKF